MSMGRGRRAPVRYTGLDRPIPEAEVEKMAPRTSPDVTFGMEALAEATHAGATLDAALDRLPMLYRDWAERQRTNSTP